MAQNFWAGDAKNFAPREVWNPTHSNVVQKHADVKNAPAQKIDLRALGKMNMVREAHQSTQRRKNQKRADLSMNDLKQHDFWKNFNVVVALSRCSRM